jgi:5-carboxymethyl-2-hydroxymuconate isomerase
MPHIILEYSDNLLPDVDVQALLNKLQDALATQGIDKARIKTRGVKLENFVVGDKGPDGAMMHGTLLLLEGRDIAAKKKLSEPLYAALKEAADGRNCAVTFEVRDMVKDTYYL